MNILFSPVGMTDPISNGRDGALIHICRSYDINKVYLYMSKETMEFHNNDNRYIYTLNKLSEKLGRNIEYEIIPRPELENVHIFDYFLPEFQQILADISAKHPNDTLYVNVSSGTPAMKSALQIMSVFRENEYIPIQVESPEKKSNPRVEDKKNYDAPTEWECNIDNTDYINRCTESGNINFAEEIKKKIIKGLVEKYDYIAAYNIAKDMALPQKIKKLLEGAKDRYFLEYQNANNIFKKYGYKILPVEKSDNSLVTEYLILTLLKAQKKEYSDFMRNLTPLFADLLERVLKDKCDFNLKDYTYTDKKGVEKWCQNKLETNAPDVNNEFNRSPEKEFTYGNIYSNHLITIINLRSDDIKLKKVCSELRDVEKEARNYAAHEMIPVTDEWIYKKTKKHVDGIKKLLLDLMAQTNIKPPHNYTRSYDKMNEIIFENM
ncbi:MAG: hypothetical protein IJS61_09040 [Firmicutes bacterium]|nr:hypothetical protein [Bacillota bacterium]